VHKQGRSGYGLVRERGETRDKPDSLATGGGRALQHGQHRLHHHQVDVPAGKQVLDRVDAVEEFGRPPSGRWRLRRIDFDRTHRGLAQDEKMSRDDT